MAQEEGGTQPQGEDTQQARQGEDTQRASGKTYTDADMDAIIAKMESSPRVRGPGALSSKPAN